MKDVRGRVVLITGAGGGIGRLMTLEFAKLGAKLVVVDKDGKAAEETASIARSLGVEAIVDTFADDLVECVVHARDRHRGVE